MGGLPTAIGPYRIVGQLGKGGMGAVYEAVHEAIGRRAAIKILHPEYSRNEEIVARFKNEARAVNLIDHPGLVQIYDCGQLDDGTSYIVMEFLKGEPLSRRLRSAGGRLKVAEALHIGWQLADALSAAHEKNIVHRDLKPENVMLIADSRMPGGLRAKVLDFGIAKISASPDGPLVRTRTNAVMGTPQYMSPEQCRGAGRVDAKSDVYSLGVILYQLFAGRPPFESDAPGELMVMHLRDIPPPIQHFVSDLPAELPDLLTRLLAKDPSVRPSMRQLADTLERLQAATAADSVAKTVQAPTVPAPSVSTTMTVSGQAATHASTTNQRRLALSPLGIGALTIVALSLATTLWIVARPPESRPVVSLPAPPQPPRVAPNPERASSPAAGAVTPLATEPARAVPPAAPEMAEKRPPSSEPGAARVMHKAHAAAASDNKLSPGSKAPANQAAPKPGQPGKSPSAKPARESRPPVAMPRIDYQDGF